MSNDILDFMRGQSDWFKNLPKGATTRITPDLAEDISAVLDMAVNEIERLRESNKAAWVFNEELEKKNAELEEERDNAYLEKGRILNEIERLRKENKELQKKISELSMDKLAQLDEEIGLL